jgi:hypothetical protein
MLPMHAYTYLAAILVMYIPEEIVFPLGENVYLKALCEFKYYNFLCGKEIKQKYIKHATI